MTLSRDRTFDDVYNNKVEEMCKYLREQGLDYIKWTYANGNRFQIRLSKAFFNDKKTTKEADG